VGGRHQLAQPLGHSGILYLAPQAVVETADLVEAPAGGKQTDHAGVRGVDVRKEHQRPNGRFGGMHREMWPRPHGVVEDRDIGPLGSHPAALTHGDFIRPYDLGTPEHLGAEPLASCANAVLDRRDERGHALVDKIAPVTEAQYPDLTHGALLK